jgi:hypothetical protein
MKNWSIYIALLFLAACSLDENPVNGPDQATQSGDPEVTLRITFPEPETPITRAVSEAKEKTIDSLFILVFTSGGTGDLLDDKYAYMRTARSGAATYNIKDFTGDVSGTTKTVTIPFKNMAQKQRFVLLANLPASLETAIKNLGDADVGVKTVRDIINPLKYKADAWRSTAFTGSPVDANFTPVPMFGQMGDSIAITYGQQVPFQQINMLRSLAKVNISLGNDANKFYNDFKITQIYVCNASDSAYVTPHYDYLQGSISNVGKTHATTVRNATDIVYSVNLTPGQGLVNSVYVPESDSLIIQGTDTLKPAFLVIKTQFKKTTSSPTLERYYRIDFTRDLRFIPVLRNHSYNLNITGVRTDGYATLDSAKNAMLTTLNFAVTIEGSESSINDITVYNDQYLIGLSHNEVIFDWDKQWIGKPVSGGTTHFPMRIYSTYNSGEWTIDRSPSSSYFTVTKSGSNVLQITAVADNHTGFERRDSIILRAGLITKTILLRQSGGANAVLLRFASGQSTATVDIPLGFLKAARGWTSDLDGKQITAFRARLVWQESDGLSGVTFGTPTLVGTAATACIRVTASSSAHTNNNIRYGGNALVSLVWDDPGGVGPVGSYEPDQIVWSWHVWAMPDFNGYTSVSYDFHDPNQSVLMAKLLGQVEREIGAEHHYGMVYQWGRKDPFYKASLTSRLGGVTPAVFHNMTIGSANNVDVSIKLPTTFIVNTWQHDWAVNTGSGIPDLWNGVSKTKYDPCPVGWRVPERNLSPWQNDPVWTDVAKREMYYNRVIMNQYTLLTVTEGTLWTSTTTTANSMLTAYTVKMRSGGFEDPYSHGKGCALSVRCIKDLEKRIY